MAESTNAEVLIGMSIYNAIRKVAAGATGAAPKPHPMQLHANAAAELLHRLRNFPGYTVRNVTSGRSTTGKYAKGGGDLKGRIAGIPMKEVHRTFRKHWEGQLDQPANWGHIVAMNAYQMDPWRLENLSPEQVKKYLKHRAVTSMYNRTNTELPELSADMVDILKSMYPLQLKNMKADAVYKWWKENEAPYYAKNKAQQSGTGAYGQGIAGFGTRTMPA